MTTNFDWLSRTELILGRANLEKLATKNVLIVGLGGVGSFAAEAIARAGIGKVTIVDGDTVDRSNRNRQLPALFTTEGQSKADIMAERMRAINPEIELTAVKEFMDIEDMRKLLASQRFDYVMDCIDSLMPKLTLLSEAYRAGVPIISAMGAGGRMDPTKVKIDDLSRSYNCRLAFYVRKRLRKFGIHGGFKVVFSSELPNYDSLMLTDGARYKRSAYGTTSYMPAIFGLAASSVVIRELTGYKV